MRAGQAGAVEQAPVELLSLRLVPEEITIWGAEGLQRYLVLGRFSDGLERDVTLECRFLLSGARVAALAETRRVVSLADGEAVLKAEKAGKVAKARIRVEGSREKTPFSFERGIVEIFTKRGCNDSHCHGGVKGRGGFKLSFNGLHPHEDYKWIVEGGGYQVLSAEALDPKNPRVNLKEPEKSLLLLKPTLAVSHGGGLRFPVGSPEYHTILNWVRSGAPYGEEGEHLTKVVGREVLPRDVVLDLQGKNQLLVMAHLSDGRREDYTDRVIYESNSPEAVHVNSDGVVEARRPGEAAVIVRSPGEAASVRVGVISHPVRDYPRVAPNNLIDEHVFDRLRKFQIIPSDVSTDAEFLRRACLDITGTLPPPARIREFLSNRDPGKRTNSLRLS